MPVFKVKNNGVWEDVVGISAHTHTISDITDFPTDMPTDGGDADTLDGKHAEEFASVDSIQILTPGSSSAASRILTADSNGDLSWAEIEIAEDVSV